MTMAPTRRDAAAGLMVGVALGGFFDGILLHQILQWHHLLSAVDGADVRFQVAADGYFHALMYVVAGVGLWILWRGRGRVGGLRLAVWLLMGFGLWHVLDAVLSHWLLGIHRIRMDSGAPLAWDLGWLIVFGLAPLALGWFLRRRGALPPPSRSGASVLGVLALMIGLGIWAAQPGGGGFTTVLFAPGTEPREAFEAVAATGGRIAWSDPSGQLIVYEPRSGAAPSLTLYARGAILVSGSGAPTGCSGWSRA